MERNLKAKQQLAEISERRLKDTVDKLKDAGDKLGEQETRHKKEIKLLYLEID